MKKKKKNHGKQKWIQSKKYLIKNSEEREIEKEDIWDDMLGTEETISDEEISNRLSIMNFDWTLFTSTDFFVLFKSVCPENSDIISITVYLSEFGKKKLEEEKKFGPTNIWRTNKELEEHRKLKRGKK
jgi:hypothetical protein